MIRRLPWLIAAVLLVAWAVICWQPVRTGAVRAALALLPVMIALCVMFATRTWWRWHAAAVGVVAMLCVIIATATPRGPSPAAIVTAARSYLDVPYVWGGESSRGIDCSGLIRRSFQDAALAEGLRHCSPGLLRTAMLSWWRDQSAADLLAAATTTTSTGQTGTLNGIRAAAGPGDLAVTTSGAHVLMHLGGGSWIQASPEAGRVVVATAPNPDDHWFAAPVAIVRWKLLSP
jgi:hypothetical protein